MLSPQTYLRAGVLIIFVCATAVAQETSSPTVAPPPPSVAGEDSDPTRPVVWSLREEYYNLPGDSWNNAFLFRIDRAVLKERPWPLGKNGVVSRIDIPFLINHTSRGTRAGLGDIYAQAFLMPIRRRKFVLAAGSGVSLPTATSRQTGTGKLTIAPVTAPVWFIPKRGFFFVKVQDYFSVAGAGSRPGLHYMTITPLLVWRIIGKPYWIQLDGESQTNWNADAHTGYKAGILLGHIKKRRGVWIKVEVGMGHYRVASIVIKTSIFKVR